MKPPTPESHTNKIQLLAHREQPKPKPTGITEGRKLLLHQFRKQPPAIRNLQKQQFNEGMFDVNGDGVIDIEEAKMARQLDRQTNFTEIDIDGDGEVSQDEMFVERQIAGRDMLVQNLIDEVGQRNFNIFGHQYRGMSEEDFKDHAVYHPHHALLMVQFRGKERGHRLNGSDQIAGCWKHQEQPRQSVFPCQVKGQSWLSPPFGDHFPYGRTGAAESAQVRAPDTNKTYPMKVKLYQQRQWG